LNPIYTYQKPSGGVHRYGDIEGARPKVTMKDVQEMLNQRIEPTWLSNQKFALLRPEPQRTLDTNIGSLSPDQMSQKSFY